MKTGKGDGRKEEEVEVEVEVEVEERGHEHTNTPTKTRVDINFKSTPKETDYTLAREVFETEEASDVNSNSNSNLNLNLNLTELGPYAPGLASSLPLLFALPISTSASTQLNLQLPQNRNVE